MCDRGLLLILQEYLPLDLSLLRLVTLFILRVRESRVDHGSETRRHKH